MGKEGGRFAGCRVASSRQAALPGSGPTHLSRLSRGPHPPSRPPPRGTAPTRASSPRGGCWRCWPRGGPGRRSLHPARRGVSADVTARLRPPSAAAPSARRPRRPSLSPRDTPAGGSQPARREGRGAGWAGGAQPVTRCRRHRARCSPGAAAAAAAARGSASAPACRAAAGDAWEVKPLRPAPRAPRAPRPARPGAPSPTSPVPAQNNGASSGASAFRWQPGAAPLERLLRRDSRPGCAGVAKERARTREASGDPRPLPPAAGEGPRSREAAPGRAPRGGGGRGTVPAKRAGRAGAAAAAGPGRPLGSRRGGCLSSPSPPCPLPGRPRPPARGPGVGGAACGRGPRARSQRPGDRCGAAAGGGGAAGRDIRAAAGREGSCRDGPRAPPSTCPSPKLPPKTHTQASRSGGEGSAAGPALAGGGEGANAKSWGLLGAGAGAASPRRGPDARPRAQARGRSPGARGTLPGGRPPPRGGARSAGMQVPEG